MKIKSRFKPYSPDQQFLFPQNMKQWLPEDDLVYFIMDVVKQLDLREIYRPYECERRGQPPYNPTMMVTLLIYAYAVGMPSSRKIEKATYHSIPFRVLTANQHPDQKMQRNFTDPESRIMPIRGGKDFIQGYNCQTAVDKKAQVIVSTHVTQATNDTQQVLPLVKDVALNIDKELPKIISADSGYFSEANCHALAESEVDAYIATGRLKHGETALSPRGRISKDATTTQKMARKLQTLKGRKTYSLRKQIVEPVFGQIKEARNFRRFIFRGLTSCQHEWDVVCLTHNLLKLFRGGYEFNRA